MIRVSLTEADMADLGDAATINIMDENGNEHELSGPEIGLINLDALTDGESLPWGDLMLTYPEGG